MRDFYEVLGIPRTASVNEIRAAYKRLAKQYHPDRNPGNPHAEEHFKDINEAYHTLCNPVKKADYDFRLNYRFITYRDPYFNQKPWSEVKKRRYYQWQRSQETTYRFDKNYFKIQGLAFLVFLIIAGFSFSIIHTAHYYVRKQQLQRIHEHTERLKQANGLFGEGRFTDAFELIDNLKKEDPLEYRFGFARDSLVNELRRQADMEFKRQDFHTAIEHYTVLKQYEHPIRFETLENISICQYYLGNYEESLIAMKHLHNQQPYNLGLIYQIGMINLEKLNNPDEALQYFTLGKKLFKQNLSEVYGAAFQIVMDPYDAPDIYYHIFLGRAQANFRLDKYKEAVTDCNWAIFLRRDRAEPYYIRALVNISKNDMDNVCEDLHAAESLGLSDISRMVKKYCGRSRLSANSSNP